MHNLRDSDDLNLKKKQKTADTPADGNTKIFK